MNVAEAAAILNAWVDAGDGQLPFVVATAETAHGYILEEAMDLAPISSAPPAVQGGIWLDGYDPGEPHTAIAAV